MYVILKKVCMLSGVLCVVCVLAANCCSALIGVVSQTSNLQACDWPAGTHLHYAAAQTNTHYQTIWHYTICHLFRKLRDSSESM